MNGELLTKIKENYRYFGGISFIYGLFFTFCLYGNFSGITFPLCVIATIYIYYLFLKKIGIKIKRRSIKYLVGIVMLGFANCYTANSIFIFLDVVAILLLFIIFMIQQFYDDSVWKISFYINNMLCTVGTFFAQILSPFTDGMQYAKKRKRPHTEKTEKVKGIFVGILISIPVLLVVLPLLLKSDMIFTKIFKSIFQIPDFESWNLDVEFAKMIMFLIGVICCYGFFRGMCSMKLKTEQKEGKKTAPVIGITLNSIMAVLYMIYCGVQIIYLFMGFDKGLPAGVTYAEYARSGFFELLFVSFINFFLVLASNAFFAKNKFLKILLFMISGCTFIMIGSSAYRMILYIKQYHLTFLRVMVLWFLLVLTLFIIGLLMEIQQKKFSLFRYMVVVMMCCYIPFVYSRPEALIAEYNISQGNMTWDDIHYLIYSGYYDSIPALTSIKAENLAVEDQEAVYKAIESQIAESISFILADEDGTYSKTEDIEIRKMNYSKYKAKKAAKEYLNKINRKNEGGKMDNE